MEAQMCTLATEYEPFCGLSPVASNLSAGRLHHLPPLICTKYDRGLCCPMIVPEIHLGSERKLQANTLCPIKNSRV